MPIQLRRYMFLSQLASPDDLSCVAEIFQQLRGVAHGTGLTGVLVFDGDNFCHYLEGPAPALNTLVQRIASDARHTNMTTLLDSALHGPRLFKTLSTAYTTHDEIDTLRIFAHLRDQAAVDQFMAMVPSFDGIYD